MNNIWDTELPVLYDTLSANEKRVVRKRYASMQGNRCAYCRELLDSEPSDGVLDKEINWSRFPEGFLLHPVHLHHDRKTGLTLGVVHALCNAVLFEYEGE